MMKYWEILLIKQRERGKDGLTLPFLIGSQMFLPKSVYASNQNIRKLIIDIVENNDLEVCLRYCMAINTYILEIKKSKNTVYYPLYRGNFQESLSVAIFHKEKLGNEIEQIIDNLNCELLTPINSNLFSADANVASRSPVWREFTEDEIRFIEESFGT